jgi:hypothetical protein
MTQALNLINQRFGRLTVLRKVDVSNGGISWYSRCDCGKISINSTKLLRAGKAKSCGCLNREIIKTVNTKHGYKRGGTNDKTYRTWRAIKERCNCVTHVGYKNYGGRGIKVCEDWEKSFDKFLLDMGEKPEGYSLERIDVDRDYCKDNCKWIPLEKQCLNKRNTVYLTYKGETKTAIDWAKIKNLPCELIRARKRLNWGDERILETPKR